MLCDKTKNYKFLFRSLHEKRLVPVGCKPIILWPISLYPASRGLFLAWLLARAESFIASLSLALEAFFSTNYNSAQLFEGRLSNRPLALSGHVTNASFWQWVGILLMPKIDRAHNNYLTPEIWQETHLREIFYCTLIFQQIGMNCIGGHVGGHTLALQHGG